MQELITSPAEAGGIPLKFVLLIVGLAALGLLVAVIWHRLQDPQTVFWLRLRFRIHPGPGFATKWELWRRYGLPRARKVAKFARPSLRQIDLYGPGAWREYATFLGWGQGWVHRWRVYASFSDIVLTIAAPQKGKSAAAAGRIIDAPGPVVVTSIRGDLIKNTAGLRQTMGVLHVFNPENVGDFGSTFRWNPVRGCHDMQTAIRRAGHMVEAVEQRGLSDATFWSDQAVQVIASYMHAAGLVRGGTMSVVYRWIATQSRVPVDILSQAPTAARMASGAIAEFQELNERTRQSIETTCRNVLRFMISPEVEQALTPDPHGRVPEFVIGDFLRSRDTLYLVASADSGSTVPPLLCALLAELKHEAVLLGSHMPAGRLDPPLSMELDEVANVTPIPLPAWASYAAGSGIRLSIYSQSWGQIVGRWGANAADTLWQTATCKVIMGGSSEQALLRKVSELCGRTKVRVTRTSRVGRDGRPEKITDREWVEVLPADAVRRLPPTRAIVVMDAGKPAVVRVEQVWKRADVKAWQRSGQTIGLPPRGLPVSHPIAAGTTARALDSGPDGPATLPNMPAVPNLADVEARAEQPTRDDLAARRARRRPYETTTATGTGQTTPGDQPRPLDEPPAPRTANGWDLSDL